jgi:transcriptional regulator with XRE-family HTH domain
MEKSPTTYAFWTALDHFFGRSGWTKKELAFKAGIGKSTVTELLQRKIGRKPELQARVAVAFGFDLLDFLAVGQKIIAGEKDLSSERVVPSAGDCRPIPLYESWRLAAGANGLAFDPFEQTDRHLLLSVAELGGRAHHDLRAVRVGGTSMEPLIPEGSVVVLDLADRDFVDGRIYAVAVEEGGVEMVATVKRVRRMDGAFVLWPENSAYSPQIARGDWPDICVGRVVWLWRSLERA